MDLFGGPDAPRPAGPAQQDSVSLAQHVMDTNTAQLDPQAMRSRGLGPSPGPSPGPDPSPGPSPGPDPSPGLAREKERRRGCFSRLLRR